MVDFNYESLKALENVYFCHYDMLELFDLMQIYFNDRTKFEPRINGKLKDDLMYEIMERLKDLNSICKNYLHIDPLVPEDITKEQEHELIYKYFEKKMGFNKPKSKYMTEPFRIGFDEQYFSDERVCYKCQKCKESMELPIELVNEMKEKNRHIGRKCSTCNTMVFPLFIRDKERKVIMKY